MSEGPLRPQSQFLWTTPVPATEVTPATTLYVTSTVQQLEELACIRWSGPAMGEGVDIDRGVHVWTFTEIEGGVLVSAEETWTGRQVDANPGVVDHSPGAGLAGLVGGSPRGRGASVTSVSGQLHDRVGVDTA
jgi:hypothetical protein